MCVWPYQVIPSHGLSLLGGLSMSILRFVTSPSIGIGSNSLQIMIKHMVANGVSKIRPCMIQLVNRLGCFTTHRTWTLQLGLPTWLGGFSHWVSPRTSGFPPGNIWKQTSHCDDVTGMMVSKGESSPTGFLSAIFRLVNYYLYNSARYHVGLRTTFALTVYTYGQAKRGTRPLLRDINSYAQAGGEGTFVTGCLAVATKFLGLVNKWVKQI